jgi:GxxExxY protein
MDLRARDDGAAKTDATPTTGEAAMRADLDHPQRRVMDTELEDINNITDRIIGCAIEVHRILRCGLFESVYRSALAIEFDAAGLSYEREARLPAVYKGHLLGHYRVDFVVQDQVILEVKSVERHHPVFEAQLMTYLRLKKKRVGLLINFNSSLLKHGIKRIIV